jgi:ABC-type transport system involved in cytochrome bd biosynthesis fused ATPase/permease subunit
MRHPKISIASSAVATGILAAITVLFLTFNTPVGYGAGLMFFLLTLFWVHRLYTKLWLYNGGKPLSEEKKHKREQLRYQVRDYKRYNLYHVWYRFADATEDEYQAEKAKEALKKLKRK